MKAAKLLELIDDSHVAKGNKEAEIVGLAAAHSPRPDHLSFIKDQKFAKEFFGQLEAEQSYALMMPTALWDELEPEQRDCAQLGPVILSEQVDLAMARFSRPFYQERWEEINTVVDGRQNGTAKVHPSSLVGRHSFVGEHVTIEADVTIHPGVTIMPHVHIARGTEIFPSVVIYPFTSIGQDCRIHSQVSIGSDGFGYQFHEGVHEKIWHLGGVQIGNRVEVGACTTIDGGTFSPTTIGDGVIIDNQVQIAHNCRVGQGSVLCGQSGLGGSAVLEDFVVIGGKAGIGPSVKVGAGSQIAGNAMVTRSCPPESVLGGHPARPLREWMKATATLFKLAKER